MKENIHPQYGEAVVRCACGETFVTGSTRKNSGLRYVLSAILSSPESKLVDTGGRVGGLREDTAVKTRIMQKPNTDWGFPWSVFLL